MLLMHSFFVVAFFYFTYTYYGSVTKLTSSAVTRIEVSSELRKSLIWNVFCYLLHAIIELSKTLVQVFKRENDLMQ